MSKRLLLTSLFSLSAVAGFAHAEGPASAPATQPATTHPATQPAADTTTVKRGALSITIDSQGSFEPIDLVEVRIRPKAYNGELTITSVAANGTAVKKGDILLEVDSAPIKRIVAAADNDLLNAQATVKRAEADAKIAEDAETLALKQQQAALKEAEDSLKWFLNMDGPQYLKQIDLALQQYQDQVKDAGDELDQLKKMYKSEELTNATADVVVRQAMRKLEVSKELAGMMKERANKARVFTYPMLEQRFKDAAELARQQFTLFESAQAQLKVQRQTGMNAVKAALAAAELRDHDLKADEEKLTVRAPSDGVVSYGQIVQGNWQGADPRTLRVGERAMPQAVLMTVFTPGKFRLVVDVAESRYFAIKAGQKASISPIAYPELKYEGQCEPDQRTPGGGGSFALHIATGEVDSRLAPGMKASVHMDVPLVDNALLVPNGSLSNSTVWVKTTDGAEESRHVLTGRSDGKQTEILSGLKEGEEILTHAKPAT